MTFPRSGMSCAARSTTARRTCRPGAGPSVVNDDYTGTSNGVYVALTGEGYSYKDLYETAKILQRELLMVQDVKGGS
jgi:hypothetical protein